MSQAACPSGLPERGADPEPTPMGLMGADKLIGAAGQAEKSKSGPGEGGGPLVQVLEQLQSAIVSEKHLSRVGVEGEHHGLCGFLPGLSDHPVEECLMPEVHAVEGARGHDAPDALGEMGKTVVDVHCIQR